MLESSYISSTNNAPSKVSKLKVDWLYGRFSKRTSKFGLNNEHQAESELHDRMRILARDMISDSINASSPKNFRFWNEADESL